MATLLRVTVRESDAAPLQTRDNRRSRIFGFMGWGAAVVAVLLVALAVRELVHDDYACHCPEYYQAVETTFDWPPATYSGALVRYETRSEIDANIATASIQLTATDPDLAAARIEERLLQLGFEWHFESRVQRYLNGVREPILTDGTYRVLVRARPEFGSVTASISGPPDPQQFARTFSP